jgi:hypothetical protein
VKKLVLILVSAVLYATPVVSPDGVQVPPGDPNLGAPLIGAPNQVWQVWFNDNIDGVDFDFNDAVVEARFGASTFDLVWLSGTTMGTEEVGVLGQAGTVSILNPLATYNYTPGEVILFDFVVGNGTFYTGPGSRNPDGLVHAWVACVALCQSAPDVEAPEPSSYLLVASSLAGGWLLRRRKQRK